MKRVDPHRIDLVEAFHAAPFGPHGAELLDLLRILRWAPLEHRYIVVHPDPVGPYLVARQYGRRGTPLHAVAGEAYEHLPDAQCGAFRLRWEAATGYRLAKEGGGWRAVDAASAPARELVDVPRVEKPLLGYADVFTVRPGETIAFKLSSTQAADYEASLVRLRCADGTEGGAGYKETTVASPFAGRYPGRVQPSCPGSFVDFADGPAWHPASFTVQAWVWPTLPGCGVQHIAGAWDESGSAGYALVLDETGAPALRLGDGATRTLVGTGVPLRERAWYLLAASYDAARGEVTVVQAPREADPHRDRSSAVTRAVTVRPAAGGPFRIAACNDARKPPHRASALYNGKIEAPSLAARALSASETGTVRDSATPIDFGAATVGRWDFSREIGTTRVIDVSANARHGTTVNMPTRAMKGVCWDGSEYNFRQRPEHYGAIHFHDDDLHDCAWQTDFSFTVPDDFRSGIYAAKVEAGGHEAYVPFVVSPPLGTAQADVALILPTASYWAYANHLLYIEWPEVEQVIGFFTVIDDVGLYLFQSPHFGLSMYDRHTDGSGVCHSSRLRPTLDLSPKQALWQFPADTHLTDWLEAKGIPFDVITEDCLDRHGASLLEPYRCVMTGTHPEYPSLRMMAAYDAYKARGGRFMYMGGNGFYWRTSYHPELPGIVEMRRAEDGIRSWAAEGGEYYHSFTGELGGMWRRMGRPPQTVAGTGMTAQGFDQSTYYLRTPQSHDPRVAFIFAGVGDDERIGDFGIIGGGAAGWEVDRADPALGTPPHALVVATATEFTSTYHWMKEELSHTHSAITGTTCPHVRSDMVFYETPNGGAVFAVSSIAWAGALAHRGYDNNVSRITGNVVRRFVDPAPFE